MSDYYNTQLSNTVRESVTKKLYRISVRNKIPYVTYKRNTRVLFKNEISGAYVNINGSRVYFL